MTKQDPPVVVVRPAHTWTGPAYLSDRFARDHTGSNARLWTKEEAEAAQFTTEEAAARAVARWGGEVRKP